MKLKKWLSNVKSKMVGQDFYSIQYRNGSCNGRPWYSNIDEDSIKHYPLLAEVDVIEEHTYDSQYSLLSLTGANCGGGKCKEYCCEVDSDQVKLAMKQPIKRK